MLEIALLGMRNHALSDLAELLAAGGRGHDPFMFDQRRHHIPQHSPSMLTITVQIWHGDGEKWEKMGREDE